jgi:hypothetical protein
MGCADTPFAVRGKVYQRWCQRWTTERADTTAGSWLPQRWPDVLDDCGLDRERFQLYDPPGGWTRHQLWYASWLIQANDGYPMLLVRAFPEAKTGKELEAAYDSWQREHSPGWGFTQCRQGLVATGWHGRDRKSVLIIGGGLWATSLLLTRGGDGVVEGYATERGARVGHDRWVKKANSRFRRVDAKFDNG